MNKLETFQKERLEQFNAALDISHGLNNGKKIITCSAPVKSGKRQIAQILSMLYARPNREFFFITSLNRKDIQNQLKEHKEFNLEYAVLSDSTKAEDVILKIKNAKDPIVLFDECDFGSGKKQIFQNVWDHCIKKLVPIVGFSATPEELLFASIVDYTTFFIPNQAYKGISWFYINKLCHEAEPFLQNGSLSKQGQLLIDQLLNSDKSFGIIRFVNENKKNCADLQNIINNQYLHQISVRVVSENKPFVWDDSEEATWRGYVPGAGKKPKTLIVINQTSTRSTEWAFQKHILFFHDFRDKPGNINSKNKNKKGASCNTIAQSILRPSHYDSVGHPVHLYSDLSVLKILSERESLIYNYSVSKNITDSDVKKELIADIKRIFSNTDRQAASRVSNNINDKYNWHHICDIDAKMQSNLSKNSNFSKNEKLLFWIDKLRLNGVDFWTILKNSLNRTFVIEKPRDKYQKFWDFSNKEPGEIPEKVNEIISNTNTTDKEKIELLQSKKETLSSFKKVIDTSDLVSYHYSIQQSDDLFKCALDEKGGSGGAIITINVYDKINPNQSQHKISYNELNIKYPNIFASILVPRLDGNTKPDMSSIYG